MAGKQRVDDGRYRGTQGRKEREQDAARRDEGSATPNLTYPQAREVPGVKVFRSSATMYFANAELYSDMLKQRVRPGVHRGRGRGSLTSPASTSPALPFALVRCERGPPHLPEEETAQEAGAKAEATSERE